MSINSSIYDVINATYVHPIDTRVMYVLCAILSVTFFVAVSGNGLVILSFCRKSNLRRRPSNIYTINLAFGNFCLGIFAGMISGQLLNGNFIVKHDCAVNGFLVSTIHISVMITIMVMITERYHVICHKETRFKFVHKFPLTTLMFIWIYSVTWSSLPFLPYIPNYIKEPLMPCCIFDRITASTENRTYVIGMCVFVLFLPSVFIGYCLIRIYRYVKKSTKILKKHEGFRSKGSLIRKESKRSLRCSSNEIKTDQFSIRVKIATTNTTPSHSGGKERITSEICDVIEPKNYLLISSPKLTPKKILRREKSNTLSQCSRGSNISSGRRKKQVKELAILKSVILIMILFILSWVPFSVVVILNLYYVYVNPYLVLVSYVLAKGSCIHSSLVYITNSHLKATMDLIKRRSAE